jgi:predicted aldo/keto reductase-like oxidoreductase
VQNAAVQSQCNSSDEATNSSLSKRAGKCRFIGFTGHHDPAAHVEMLQSYDKFDTILMPLHAADPSYLSFEQKVLPEAVKQGLGIQGMKITANSKLLQAFSVRECINYTLSLPIHCVTLGATTVGQIEDDVRMAQQFNPYTEAELAQLRKRAEAFGALTWKTGNATRKRPSTVASDPSIGAVE